MATLNYSKPRQQRVCTLGNGFDLVFALQVLSFLYTGIMWGKQSPYCWEYKVTAIFGDHMLHAPMVVFIYNGPETAHLS